MPGAVLPRRYAGLVLESASTDATLGRDGHAPVLPQPVPTFAPAKPVRVVRPCKPGIVNAWRDAWNHRSLLSYFGQNFLRKRTARTWLGILWIPLLPTWNLAARILVFGGLIGVSAGRTPYPLYFVVSTALWQLFHETLTWAARSLELNRKTLQEVYVPRLLLVASALVPALYNFAVYLGFAIIGLVYYRVRAGTFYLDIGPRTLLVPVGVLSLVLLATGLGLILAGVGARSRDVRFSLGFGLGFLYFLTPVIYPLSKVPSQYRPIAELNPLTGAMEMVKRGLFDSETFSMSGVYVSVAAIVFLWVPVFLFIRRRELALANG